MLAIRSVAASRTACVVTIGQKAACMQISSSRNAHSQSQSDRKTNQQERAIRVKSMQKAALRRNFNDSNGSFSKDRNGRGYDRNEARSSKSMMSNSSIRDRRHRAYDGQASTEAFPFRNRYNKDQSGRNFGRREMRLSQPMMSNSSIREKRYKASQNLMQLLSADMTASAACEVAIEKVEAMQPFVRRSTYVYNPLLRHLLRAGRGTQAIRTMQEMKKNGVSPSVETFLALFMGAVRISIHAKKDTNLIYKFSTIFDQFVEFWNDAIRHDQGMIEREDVDSEPMEEERKGKLIKYTNTTAESYRTTQIEAWESAIVGYVKFCKAMDHYLEFMLYLGFDEKAARVFLGSAELAKPAWSKSGKNYAPGMVQTLARRILAHDHKPSKKTRDEEVWQEAIEHARLAIKDEEGNRALKLLDRQVEERRWKTMQRSNQFSLALSEEDRRQLFDEETANDGPPRSSSRV
ncbi:uncharacterized protein FA14DRAFT_160688 [Meira miltonrushii]|uniref:Uncharacterized protein n=1 Tax=Meira miltonrushii TaxID=1280837 RepID=A0A316VH14_9BASI|nr:uncharacterized protein FA14DRAFT_160688 [Meira miltonrushii]PWN35623.1 hypothetical protein FA14DRAFT_160688 [Meira miltonrushii]